MLNIKRTKELLNHQSISDEKAEKIRNEFCLLAEIIFEQWVEKRKKDEKFIHKPMAYINKE